MKKLFPILTFLFGSIPFLAVAQSEGLGPYIGATTGINMTWIVIDNELSDNEHHEAQPTFGPTPIGLALGYKWNDKNSIQVESYWSKQGSEFDLLNSDRKVVGRKEIDLTYIAVPVLFKISGTGTTRFNLHLGPQVSFLLRGEEVNTFNEDVKVSNPNMGIYTGTTIPAGTYSLSHTDTDMQKAGNSKFNTVDPSVILGLGVEHDFNPQLYLSANLRFNYSWSNILQDETVTRQYDLDTYTLRYNVFGGLQIGLHYFFREP